MKISLILALALLFTGCSRQVSTQIEVFVVTNAAQTLPLGDVDVYVMPRAEYDQIISSAVENQTQKNQRRRNNAAERIKITEGEINELDSKIREVEIELNNSNQKEKAELKRQEDLYNQIKERKVDSHLGVNHARYLLSEAEKPLRQRISEMRKEIEEKHEAIDRDRLIQIQSVQPYRPSDLFGVITSEPIALKRTTDAKGAVLFKLEKGDYVVLAKAERAVFGMSDKEYYYWIIPHSITGKESGKIILSNRNLTESEQNLYLDYLNRLKS